MGLLSQIQTGKTRMPPRLLVYGTEGIGKSTLAASAPKPIFVQTEDGLGEIDCHKFPLAKTHEDVEHALAELHEQQHPYQSVIIDSVDWLERLIWDRLCRSFGVSSIEKVDGGYGKGYVHALTHWRKILDRLAALRDDRGMMVVLLAHAKVEKFEDPEAPTYDRYSPRLNKHASALLAEWCDAVLFATRKIITRTEDGSFNRSRTLASGQGRNGGERILRCIGGPSCIAKNRYSLPAELPLSWPALMEAISGTMTSSTNTQPATEGEQSDG
ncbi:MAG: ATP-binding protein [Planctomycetaceae bacterium]|nr:ATP-binding protein [Planctomycetaceae bacterium]